MLVRRQSGRELVEEHLHGVCGLLRQHQGEASSGGRLDRGEQMNPSVALVAQSRRTLSAHEPAMTQTSFLPESRLIVEPERQALGRMLRGDAVEFALQPPFTKASLASGFAFGCEGRVFCHDKPSFFISLDMWPS